MRFFVAIGAVLLTWLPLYAQGIPEPKNDIGVSIGYSWPLKGTLYGLRGKRTFETSNAPAFLLAYTRCIRGPWVWRLNLSYSNYQSTRINWHGPGNPHPSHNIPIKSIDAIICYRFITSKAITPYLGLGINLMQTSHDDDKVFVVQAWGDSLIRPTSKVHLGPSVLAGMSWKLTNTVSLTTEARYCYNGWVAEKWVWHGYHVGSYNREGEKTIYLNPLNITMGLSFRW